MLNLNKYIKQTHLTTHSCKRFWEYIDEHKYAKHKDWTTRKIKRLVAKHFAYQIVKGLPVDSTDAIHLPIKYGMYAALILKDNGYLVVTFHKNEKNININDIRKNLLS